MRDLLVRHRREAWVLAAYVALLVGVAVVAPSFFSAANLRDLALGCTPVLVAAIGMTLVIVAGQIDISSGSQFAICAVAAGVFAKTGMPMVAVVLFVVAVGAALGALNGALVAGLRIPSIVVTLATMLALRDGLRLLSGGAWVQGLPAGFQWFGFSQAAGEAVIVAAGLLALVAFGWMSRNLAACRAIYATGSDPQSAALAGIRPRRVIFGVFALQGALVGLAALLQAVRFTDVPGNAGAGLEMNLIAAVVVGGTSIRGGRGTLAGTLLGVLLLGTIRTALTYLGVSASWEKAVQGAIILAAVAVEGLGQLEIRRRLRVAAR